MQFALRASTRDVHGKGLQTPTERAGIRRFPVKAGQEKQGLEEPCRLPQRNVE